ncbi:MAG: hypothetical protein AABZ23_06430 [Deltaproteobacteria bacterium]
MPTTITKTIKSSGGDYTSTAKYQYLLDELPDARRRWFVNMSLIYFDENGIASVSKESFIGAVIDKNVS